jgi:HNH endonuclease/NUMOD4 motif
MKIVWKPIPGWPEYEASDGGRIKSITRVCPHNRYPGKTMIWKEKILKPGRQHSGHLFVVLTGQKAVRVHRLVALAFIGPAPFPGALVRHVDDDPSNNKPSNLVWGTQKENMADAIRNGQHLGGYRPKGSTHIGGGVFNG